MHSSSKGQALPARALTLIAFFAALTAVLAQIAVPLPFTPVPLSFGLVAVYATGILLRPRHAVYAQACYLALGAIGIPVFGGFRGGISALLGPTGGYLLVYPAMVWIVSAALNGRAALQADRTRGGGARFLRAGLALCAAHLLLYLGGTAWLSLTTGNTFRAALALAVLPFIPLDIVKILFCVLAIVPVRTRLARANLLMLA